MSTDTIFAPATAPGRSGVAVFRLSGPQALAAVQALSGRQTFPARKALRVVLSDPQTQTPLDDGLAIFFPAPRSFTGEDVVELHIHGGHATQSAIHKALVTCPGLRLAEPGAFTKRGYLNGKMDLAQVEALADLVAAETEQQRLQALEASKGALGQSCRHWRDRLARGYAHLCAVIDFPDEDLPDHIEAQLRTDIQTLCAEIESGLKAAGRTERIRSGVTVAIVGPPNAGKSSLLNHLAGRNAAIVSDLPGTTRDVIEIRLDIDGYPVLIWDTAGVREGGDQVEQEGIRRARERAENADLVIVCLDGHRSMPADFDPFVGLAGSQGLLVLTKADLGLQPGWSAGPDGGLRSSGVETLGLSVVTEQGLDAFQDLLAQKIQAVVGAGASIPDLVVTRERQRIALEEALAALQQSQAALSWDFMAEDLRMAMDALGEISGAVSTDDVLDIIFRDFCIGK